MSEYEDELKAFIFQLQHGSDLERYDATTALSHYTHDSDPLSKTCKERAVQALIHALENDPDSFGSTRAGAATALGRLGDSRAIGPLTKALQSKHANVRDSAREALEKMHQPVG